MIFDKDNRGLDELIARLGFFSGNFDFSRMVSYIDVACRTLGRIFSDAVADAVDKHYNSDAYDPFAPESSLSPQDVVTRYFQRTAAAMAYLDLAPNTDLSHDSTGRNISTTDNQRLAYDSQIERSNDALRALVSTGIDLIYDALERGEAFPEWLDSPQRRAARETLFPTAGEFSSVFDIGGSYYVFHKIVPVIRIAEATVIKPLLGSFYEKVRDCKDCDPSLCLMVRRATAVYVMAEHLVKGSMSYYQNNIVPSKATAAERNAERAALLSEFSTLSDSIRSEISRLEGQGFVRGPRSDENVNDKNNKYFYNGL